MIACCDAFNAMTTDRPYRRAKSIAAAIGELRAESGRQFDPLIVDAVIDVVAQWNGLPRRFEAAPAVAYEAVLAVH